MANRQQLRLLKQEGVKAWNHWRRENPEVAINLRGANLKGLVLRKLNLSGADIRGANFTQADMHQANLTRVKAGLQKRWAICLVYVLALIGITLSGGMTVVSAYPCTLILSSSLEHIVSGWISLLGLTVIYILLICRGFKTITITGAVIVAIVQSYSAVVAGAEGGGIAESVGAVVGVIGGAVAGAGAIAGVGAIAGAGAIVGVGVIAVITAGFTAGAGAGISPSFELDVGAATVGAVVGIILASIHIHIGKSILTGDEKYAAVRFAPIAFTTLGGTSFREANLTDTEFNEAQLKNTNFRNAIITRTDWHHSQKLDLARLGGTILDVPVVRKLAVTHNGRGQSYIGQNLKGINLKGADLSDANLTEADLSDATLKSAVLERANLTKVQAPRTQFRYANLTAACLEAWNIDSTTQLQGVICDHVYMLNGQQHRLPRSGSFAPDEFGKLFEKAFDTVDLIFADGIDWQAFFHSFQELRQQYGNDLGIQAIEKKSSGTFVVRLEVPEAFNKAALEQAAKAEYETQLQIVEASYQAKLEAKDEVIDNYKHQSADLTAIAKVLAEAPKTQFNQYNYGGNNSQSDTINVEAETMSISNESTNHFNAPVSGIVGNSFTDNAQVSGNSFNQTHNSNEPTSSDTEVPSTTILFLAANPTSTVRLRLDAELREINESLKRSQQRDQFTLINKGAVRTRDFYRAILDTQPKIVHFSGHGTDLDGLVLEDDQGNATFMGAEQLAALFEMFAAEGVECVLLNACYSNTQAQAIRQHILHVIGMNQTITDKAGIEFAVAFYDSLGAGKDVKFAFKLAKSQLIPFGEHKIPELLEIEASSTNFNNA